MDQCPALSRHRPDTWLEHQDPVSHMAQKEREKKRKKGREKADKVKIKNKNKLFFKKLKCKKKEMDRRNPRTNGKSKAIPTK